MASFQGDTSISPQQNIDFSTARYKMLQKAVAQLQLGTIEALSRPQKGLFSFLCRICIPWRNLTGPLEAYDNRGLSHLVHPCEDMWL